MISLIYRSIFVRFAVRRLWCPLSKFVSTSSWCPIELNDIAYPSIGEPGRVIGIRAIQEFTLLRVGAFFEVKLEGHDNWIHHTKILKASYVKDGIVIEKNF